MGIEQRVDKVEEAISVMKNLLVNHDERLEDYYKALSQAREDFEFRMNAVIDAQMRNEAEIDKLRKSTIELRRSTTELRKSTTELRKSTTELKEASQSQLKRIENLEEK